MRLVALCYVIGIFLSLEVNSFHVVQIFETWEIVKTEYLYYLLWQIFYLLLIVLLPVQLVTGIRLSQANFFSSK